MTVLVKNGNCLEVMQTMTESTACSIVTDPPYGLSFMGKEWDHGIPGKAFWIEALRVAKPGAHLLAFGGTRTYHRLACAIEDAGWEIRDCVMWVYGSGFPKSHNLDGEWKGWGTALKPAWEPIIVARKSLVGTVAENVAQHDTGAINVDGCRVGTTVESWPATRARPANGEPNAIYTHKLGGNEQTQTVATGDAPPGRWPANLIHDGSDEVVGLFPQTHSRGNKNPTGAGGGMFGHKKFVKENPFSGDSGSAARFFYCAKASKADRDEGCEGLEERKSGMSNGAQLNGEGYDKGQDIGLNRVISRRNHHPTVKPTALMRYLCRLVTPPGGIVLDPFMGSGSTGKAAVMEGFNFIGIEQNKKYCEIAEVRIKKAGTGQLELIR